MSIKTQQSPSSLSLEVAAIDEELCRQLDELWLEVTDVADLTPEEAAKRALDDIPF